MYLVVFRRAANHATSKGTIALVTGNGITWDAPATIYTDATYDARDPNITKLADGTLIVSLGLYDHVGGAQIKNGVRVVKSIDGGANWGAAVTVADAFTATAMECGKIVELGSGTLILPFYGKDIGDANRSAAVIFSSDGGATWAGDVVVANGQVDGRDYSEINVLLLANGNLLALIRTNTAIYASTSTDGGATWSAVASVFAGTGAPHLCQMAGGKIVCTYRSNTSSLAALRTSVNNGANWSDELVFDTSSYTGMMYATPLENAVGDCAIGYALEISGQAHVLYKSFAPAELP